MHHVNNSEATTFTDTIFWQAETDLAQIKWCKAWYTITPGRTKGE